MFRNVLVVVSLVTVGLVAIGCGSDDDAPAVDRRASVPSPLVEGPVTGGQGRAWFSGAGFPLADFGYLEEEYFLSGSARGFRNVGDLDSDGNWTVEESGETADFKTRIIVYRPVAPADFNGTVIVEWLNVSGGLDAGPDWTSLHTELIRKGYIWVGMSAQFVGVEGGGGIPGIGDLSLKGFDAARYGSLNHPGDTFSYDMFSQAGQAIRSSDEQAPLAGWPVERVIAVGESQSAFRMTTYVNAMHPLYEMYDGYLVHSRGGGAAGLSQSPQEEIPAPQILRIREDVGVPVLTFQTETDLFSLGFLPDRQDDSRWNRLWEVAGTAHADTYTLTVGGTDRGDDPTVNDVLITASPIPGILECDVPINSGPQHIVLKAALDALHRWVRDGQAPASAPRLEITTDGSGFELDDIGNVRGGIRTSWVEAPVAIHSGLGQSGGSFCFIFGTSVALSDEMLMSLYATHDDYVAAVVSATDAAVAAGYVLPADAELIIESAENLFGVRTE